MGEKSKNPPFHYEEMGIFIYQSERRYESFQGKHFLCRGRPWQRRVEVV
jgi:hypothetical protein